MAKNKTLKAVIEKSKCDGSPLCPAKRACPQKAISQKGSGLSALLGGGTAEVDSNKCTGCGVCAKYCPRGAVKLV